MRVCSGRVNVMQQRHLCWLVCLILFVLFEKQSSEQIPRKGGAKATKMLTHLPHWPYVFVGALNHKLKKEMVQSIHRKVDASLQFRLRMYCTRVHLVNVQMFLLG